jgi:hypothetical protein
MTKNQAQARIERAERHAKQDLLVSGTYGELIEGEFFGCSVGCDAWEITRSDPSLTIRGYLDLDHHTIVAEHDGTAVWFELLRDAIFEELTSDRQSWWHIESARALAGMPEDVDWDQLQTAVWIKVLQCSLEGDSPVVLKTAINKVIAHIKDPAEKTMNAAVAALEAAVAEGATRDSLIDIWECYVLVSVARIALDSPKESLNDAVSSLIGAGLPDGETLAGIILKTIKEYAIL